MKPGHLTDPELLHYGELGVVEGLSVDVAARLRAIISQAVESERMALEDYIIELEDILGDLFEEAAPLLDAHKKFEELKEGRTDD